MYIGFLHRQVVLLYTVVVSEVVWASDNAEAKGFGDGRDPASEFTSHSVVVPQLSHARTKRSITTTQDQDGHVHDITLGFNLGDEDVLVDLQLNRNLLPKEYFEKYYQNGSHYIHRPDGKMAELCHYQGTVRGRVGSWAALSTCHGVSGVVFDGEEMHYVERMPGSTPAVHSPHYVFKHSNIVPKNYSCGYSGKPHPVRDLFHDETFTRLLRYKRSSSSSSSSSTGSSGNGGSNNDGNGGNRGSSNIRGPYNANSLSRYVELVLVTDKAEYERHGHEASRLYQRCKDIANIVNALYQPLNIFIALVGVEVWKDDDQVEISTDGDKTLTNFLNYRKVRLIRDHPNDNAQLLTGKQFDAGVVGKALKGPICTYQYSGGVNMDHSDTVGLVATTVAHEMGHNFGMEHDNEEECECPDKRCIMAPSSGSKSPTHWSSCSYEYLALSFERSMDYCLRNKPTNLFDSPVCGNGFVEPGEQCDCGLPGHCTNPCCNATTCMLHPNATCATGHCCDLQTCRPRMAGIECRQSIHECDLPEFCTGDSEYCPPDAFKADGHQCLKGQAFCHSGMCRTHEEQCKLLWGPTGQSSDDRCYMMNTQGSHNGNCGYNWVNDTYYKCSSSDVKCGMLHCQHLNERLEFGMESVSKVSHSFLKSKKGVIPCRVALVDMGLDVVDPGLAPDGAKCGRGKMCVNQRCMPVSNLMLARCDCNGHGVCNNHGHCHCDIGYAPPDCLYPGLGGSEDSGPASNPNAVNTFAIGMFVAFLGVVPAVIVVLCVVYYARPDLALWWKYKGRQATSMLPHVDPNRRPPRPPGSLCVEVVGTGSVPSAPPLISSPRSPTPPSSQGSKSNSPLLNGHAKALSDQALLEKPNKTFTTGLFGRHEGFTISPLKEKSGGSKEEDKLGPTAPPLSPPPTPVSSVISSATVTTTVSQSSTVSNPTNGLKVSLVTPWQNKTGQGGNTKATTAGVSGVKMSISGPSLQGSTNPAIAGHVSKSVLPNRAAPPAYSSLQQNQEPQKAAELGGLPPPPPPNLPPVAVVTPSRRPPSLVNRPLSVPDASTLIAQASKQKELHVGENPDSKRQEGDKPSTVARIASFLTKKDKQGPESNVPDVELGRSNTLPRKATKIKRESLVQLEISAPMQLHATELPANLVPVRTAPDPPMPSNVKPSQIKASQEEATKPTKVSWAPSVPENKVKTPTANEARSKLKVTWTPAIQNDNNNTNTDIQRIGSMRETPVTIRPAIPKFGSMRAPRPKSLPPTRPSEPPPRPPLPMIPGTPESECYYDDCLNLQEDSARLANTDEDTSPTENIYATIDDEAPEKSPPLQEVTYAAPDTSDGGKKEKKSIFSFLYNKPKKKLNKDKLSNEEGRSSEPVYTNLVESPPDSEVTSCIKLEAERSARAGSSSPSITPPTPGALGSHRTSCGSSEDGGLLSEIVTELSTRDADFIDTLAPGKIKSNTGEKSNKNKVSSPTSPDSKNVTLASTSRVLSPTKGGNSTVNAKKTNVNGMNKSPSYPWRSAKGSNTLRKGSSSSSSSPTEENSSPNKVPTPPIISSSVNCEPSKPAVPRGVLAYVNSGKPKMSSISTVTNSNTSLPTVGKPSSGITKSKDTKIDTTSLTVTNTTTPSLSSNSGVSTKKSLAASLAAVRAAGAAAGEAAAAATVASNKSKPSVKCDSNASVAKTGGVLKSSSAQVGASSQASNSISKSSVTSPTSTVITSCQSKVVPTAITTTSAATTVCTAAPAATTSTTSISPIPRPSRPVFPPDKVIFAPDRSPTELSNKEKKFKSEPSNMKTFKDSSGKGSSLTSPTGGASVTRGRGTSPASKTASSASKPGRVSSSGQGTGAARGTTPSRSSSAPVSTLSEKTSTHTGSRKSVSAVGSKGDNKPGNKANEKTDIKAAEKTVSKIGIKTSDKPIEKAPAKRQGAKATPAVGRSLSAQESKPASAPATAGINTRGLRSSTSHVASLQQKFEKKQSDAQNPKPVVVKAPPRKTIDVKPFVSPKPN